MVNYQIYFCNCGEPIEPSDKWCLSCQISYEGKYDPVAEYAIRGYNDGLIILEDVNGKIIKVTQEEYIQLEVDDKVWYSFKGAIDFR